MKKSLLALLSLVLLLAGSCTKKDEVAITPLPLHVLLVTVRSNGTRTLVFLLREMKMIGL